MSIIFILSLGAMQPVVKRLCRVLLGVLPIGAVICYILSPGFEDRVNEYANLFYLFASLIAACLVLTDILRDMSDRPPFAQPVLSLAAGILFYSSTFILIHAIGAFYPLLMSKYYIYFSAVGNTFLYGGFIACYFALRRKDKEAIIATLSSSSSPD
jgi:uncharacterized membrane protein YeaQ/YmgE (transglycosylase-associated protein family)